MSEPEATTNDETITVKEDNQTSEAASNQYQDDHEHNGNDTKLVHKASFQNRPFSYSSREFDNGNVTTTCTIDWSKSNTQYVTMTGATTFTFINPLLGQRMILTVAGAYTPTWPSSVRFPSSITPTPTATSGKADEYAFRYSEKEKLYKSIMSANFATT